MHLWLSPSTEVPLRDQLVRQISLGVLSGEIGPGEKLPSVRAMARRFKLHRNTVNAAYRQLKEEKWVHSRRGSGVYVSSSSFSNCREETSGLQSGQLETLMSQLLVYAKRSGVADEELIRLFEKALHRPQELVFIESDTELARIVVFEIISAGRVPPEVCSYEPDCADLKEKLRGRVAVVMPSKAEVVRSALGPDTPILVLQINPVLSSLAAHLPKSRHHLVAIASHWPRFLEFARVLLISAAFEEDSLVFRQAGTKDWTVGLTEAANVVCDSLTRTELPKGAKPLVFALLEPAALRHFGRAAACATFESGTSA